MANKTLEINNTFSNIGESEIVDYNVPFREWEDITLITQNTTGTTVDKYFTLEFKVAENGVNFGDFWEDISNFALPYSLEIDSDLILKFRIKRVGSDSSGDIIFDNLYFEGTENINYNTLDFSGSIFKDINLSDERFNKLWVNLLNKLYYKGIVPEYIIRNETDEPIIDDEDYISFWKSISYLFSLTIELIKRNVDEQFNYEDLLGEYLKQKTFLHFQDITLTDLQYIETYMLDEMRQRGTHQIMVAKGVDGKSVDGELMRYVGYKVEDEFLYEYLPRHFSGWNVNNTSPNFTGHTSFAHNQLNKTGLKERQIYDLSIFDVTGGVSVLVDGDISVANISGGSTLSTGLMKCNSYIPYEFTFMAKFTSANSNNLTISVEVRKDGTPLNLYSFDPVEVQDKFVDGLGMPNTSVYYQIRCIVYAKQDSVSIIDPKLNIGTGVNLKFVDDETSDMNFTISNTGGSSFYVYDVKCKPLRKYKTSTYINSYNVMNLITVKRNNEVDDETMSEKIRRYLISYGTIFQPKYIPENPFEEFDPFLNEWVDGVTVEDNGDEEVVEQETDILDGGEDSNNFDTSTVFDANN